MPRPARWPLSSGRVGRRRVAKRCSRLRKPSQQMCQPAAETARAKAVAAMLSSSVALSPADVAALAGVQTRCARVGGSDVTG